MSSCIATSNSSYKLPSTFSARAPGGYVFDVGTVVSMPDGLLIGRIDDVFGPVVNPMFVIRIMNETVVSLIKPGDTLCVVEDYTKLLDTLTLNTKGRDKSDLYDEEVDDDAESDDSGAPPSAAAPPRQKQLQASAAAGEMGFQPGSVPASSASSRRYQANHHPRTAPQHQRKKRASRKPPPSAVPVLPVPSSSLLGGPIIRTPLPPQPPAPPPFPSAAQPPNSTLYSPIPSFLGTQPR
jgi:rRNA processing protein Gar1